MRVSGFKKSHTPERDQCLAVLTEFQCKSQEQNPNVTINKVKNVAIDCILDPPGSEQMKVSCALIYNWQNIWFRLLEPSISVHLLSASALSCPRRPGHSKRSSPV